MSQIGNLIKTRRKELKLMHRDIAEHLGVTSAAISNIEYGKAPLPMPKVFLLAEILKVEPQKVNLMALKSTHLFRNYRANQKLIEASQNSTELNEENSVNTLA